MANARVSVEAGGTTKYGWDGDEPEAEHGKQGVKRLPELTATKWATNLATHVADHGSDSAEKKKTPVAHMRTNLARPAIKAEKCAADKIDLRTAQASGGGS